MSRPTSTPWRSTAAWREALDGIAARENVTLHWGDAMKIDLAAFDPAPTVMVANLPYSVATPLILRTEETLPELRSWTVMVQREIADRLRAAPGSRTYGSPTATLGQSAHVSMLRPVSADVFKPRPRVASAVLRIERTGPPADAATRALIRDAFAHRRKSLARSLEIARPGRLAAAREALTAMGLPADARAESLSPEEFGELHGGSAVKYLAPAKLNLCLYLGGTRADGLHDLCSLFEPLSLADVIEVEPAAEDSVSCPGVEGEDLGARRSTALRDAGWDADPVAVRIEKRIPVAAGLGGGSADAAAVLRLARGQLGDLREAALRIGADVPSQLEPAFCLVEGAGERFERLPDPVAHGVVLLPGGGGLATADVFAEADRQGLGSSAEELARLRTQTGRRRGLGRLAARLRRPAGQRPRAGGGRAAAGHRGCPRRAAGRGCAGRRDERLGADGMRDLRVARRRAGGRGGDRPRRRDRLRRRRRGTVRLPRDAARGGSGSRSSPGSHSEPSTS